MRVRVDIPNVRLLVTLIEKESRILRDGRLKQGNEWHNRWRQGVTILLDSRYFFGPIDATDNGVCIHGLGERIGKQI
jgi:hypothetical protein